MTNNWDCCTLLFWSFWFFNS